jgi:hypothetical protein
MTRLCCLVLLIALNDSLFTGKPPLFEIHEATAEGPGKMSIAGVNPLLVIREVRAAKLAVDNKGVAICLTPEDTKKFADLSRSHFHKYLVAKATDEIMVVLYFSAANLDGCLVFHHPEEGAMAAYLRNRLHLRPAKT